MKRVVLLVALLAAVARGQRVSVEGVRFPTYDTKYYVIHTDLTGDALREAELRMTKMAEEYRARTRGFFGSADRKLPFYLFRREKDYYATGVPKESAGVFTGEALLALAGEKTDLATWHVIQHEGFHQYVHSVIGGSLPIWLNEGLAEYFGEGVFTGDGFETGLIPQWRLERVRKTLASGGFQSLKAMMNLPAEEWNSKLSVRNYDQAWTMVQFLAHGDNGRYQSAFGKFISDVGRGKQWQLAWREGFGDVDGFERRWREYWATLPNNPTGAGYGKVGVEIMTSFFARAYAGGQRFENFEAFRQALKDGKVGVSEGDWLPPELAEDGLGLAKVLGRWGVEQGLRGQTPRVALVMRDGTKVTGRFGLRSDGRVDWVRAEVGVGVRGRG